MGEQLRAIPAELKGFQGLLERNAGHFSKIGEYAENTASDTTGFTGVMALLIPVVEGVTALYGETLKFANKSLLKVKDELGNAADEYDKREQQISDAFRKIESELDKLRL